MMLINLFHGHSEFLMESPIEGPFTPFSTSFICSLMAIINCLCLEMTSSLVWELFAMIDELAALSKSSNCQGKNQNQTKKTRKWKARSFYISKYLPFRSSKDGCKITLMIFYRRKESWVRMFALNETLLMQYTTKKWFHPKY